LVGFVEIVADNSKTPDRPDAFFQDHSKLADEFFGSAMLNTGITGSNPARRTMFLFACKGNTLQK